jgi:hypothetical protein
MVRRNSRHVIRRENNILEVDFSREPDPPAPGFPGASGLRELPDGDREQEWSSDELRCALPAGWKSPPIRVAGSRRKTAPAVKSSTGII